jgi:hypothetical protein
MRCAAKLGFSWECHDSDAFDQQRACVCELNVYEAIELLRLRERSHHCCCTAATIAAAVTAATAASHQLTGDGCL